MTCFSSSATATDAGSSMYLNRNHSKKKGFTTKNKNKNNKSLSDEDDMMMIATASMSVPTLAENQDMIRQRHWVSDESIDAIEDEYRQTKFKEWRWLLSTNHSLLFFGFGSKFNLLTAFADEELAKEGYVLTLNGFDPAVTVTEILNIIVNLFLGGQEPAADQQVRSSSLLSSPDDNDDNYDDDVPVTAALPALVERSIRISKAVAAAASKTLLPVFVVVHNLDGCKGLRHGLAQRCLSELVANSAVRNGVASVRLVASIDRVDAAAVLWDTETTAKFQWIWTEVNTRRPWVHELIMLAEEEDSSGIGSGGRGGRRKTKTNGSTGGTAATAGSKRKADRVIEVLSTLAPRHAELVQILARLQLDKLNHHEGKGAAAVTQQQQQQKQCWVPYEEFRERCKDSGTVHRDSQLRSLLSELTDHELIVSGNVTKSTKKGVAAAGKNAAATTLEHVCIPFAPAKLREILAFDRRSKND